MGRTSSPLASLSFLSTTFNNGGNVNINQNINSGHGSIDELHKHVAFGALYNSNERFDPPKCHPQTRTTILEFIEQWASGSSEDAPILWLSGPAGAGKSAISQTIVEWWKRTETTTLAFFFSRTSSERNQKSRLVPTIAFQLLELFPSLTCYIEAAINAGGLFKRNLAFQLEKLVIEPLYHLQCQQPVVIVIDGLDECCVDLPKSKKFPGQDSESQQREILEALESASSKVPWLRFLIVSRPERQIRQSFDGGPLHRRTLPISLKDEWDAEADIRRFLEWRFEEIRQQHGIESSWPSKTQLSELIRKSSGQFIYPSIAIKHISTPRQNPKQSLDAVLGLHPGSDNNPLAELDALYDHVMKSVSAKSLPIITDILGYFLPYQTKPEFQSISEIFGSQTTDKSLCMFEKFLFLSEGEADYHLTDLHSVMDIPSRAAGGPISFMHATFSEYLQNQSRSRDFFISKERISERYSLLLLKHWQDWGRHMGSNMYNTHKLILCTCLWIDNCPPSKSLMAHLWSLMSVEIGHSPVAGHRANTETHPLASKWLSALVVAHIKQLQLHNSWIRGLLEYLQGCNIPEIEPSLRHRFLAQVRLNNALRRFPGI